MEQENPSVLRLPQREVLPQRVVEWSVCGQQVVVHAGRPCTRPQLLNMCVDPGAIRCLDVLGYDFNSLVGLKINEDRRALQDWLNLLRIEDVKEDDLISAKAQGSDCPDDSRGILIEVGDQNCDAAPVE